MNLHQIPDHILELVYPSALYCICCGKIIDRTRTYRLCNECMRSIRWTKEPTCRKCGKQLSPQNPTSLCFNCREHPHRYDIGFTCCEYGMNPRSIVFALKYGSRTDIGITIAEIMHDRMRQIRDETGLMYDVAIPVPMYAGKQRIRGYNQAAVIAKHFAALEDVPYTEKAIRRIRNTRPLRGLTPAERQQMLSEAIVLNDTSGIEHRDVLLIDDIYTTGATADAITDILLAGGADRVYILTFAAGADVIKSA